MAHMRQLVHYKKGIKNYNHWNEDNVAESSNFQLNPYIKEKESFILPANGPNENVSVPVSINNSTLNKQSKTKANGMSLKLDHSNDRKSHVYVHRFSKVPNKSPSNLEQGNWREGNEIHQHMYRHEYTDYYDAKIRTLRKQFDSLTLRKGRVNMPSTSQRNNHQFNNGLPNNQQSKIQYIWSNGSGKVNRVMLIRPENKSVMDKLEETYWAKWKPRKEQQLSKESFPKTKGLYTENEKNNPVLEKTQKSVRKGRGDSNKAYSITPIPSKKSHVESEMGMVYGENEEEQEEEQSASDENETETEINGVVDQQTSTSNAEIKTSTSTIHKSESECSSVKGLKHNDSFILTSQKQSQEKTHYQQPKCIKLFKNAGYTQNTSVNYVKGGSYPLRSCLKKDTNVSKPSHLGRPGSPVKGPTIKKPGKANRFTK